MSTASIVSTGNIAGTNLNGSGLSLSGNVISSLNVTGAIAGANVSTPGFVSATGNITGGNINGGANVNATLLSGTTVSVTGNITGGNVNTNTIVGTATTIKSTGDLNLSATGNIVVGTYINGLTNPVQDQDAATKSYVDSVAQGLDPTASVVYATATTLNAYTYNNGTGGVGATITANSNGILSIDSSTPANGDRVLIKNETGANQPYNGIYVVTAVGTISTPFVLTRSSDFNQPSDIPSAFVFVEAGTVNADSGYVCTTNAPVVIGTTNIVFAQFSGSGSYTANTSAGLVLIGSQFNAKVDGVTTAFDVSGNIIVKASAQLTTPNIGAATGTSVSVTGNVTSGNINTGAISLTGNVITALNVTGNIAGANVTTPGLISAGGNITGANVFTGGVVSATGNVNGGNIISAGAISAVSLSLSGNITSALNVTSSITAGTTISAVGNITGANVNTTNLSLTGNILSAVNASSSITAGTTISATGNISGGNVNTVTLSATGNVNGGNVNATTGSYVNGVSVLTVNATIDGGTY
jgi:hypothetical protein